MMLFELLMQKYASFQFLSFCLKDLKYANFQLF